jgi:hypothetical protein
MQSNLLSIAHTGKLLIQFPQKRDVFVNIDEVRLARTFLENQGRIEANALSYKSLASSHWLLNHSPLA